MSVTRRYRDAWDGFWREAPEGPGEVFWDAEPMLTAGRHLAHFEPYLVDPALPLIDLGCGNGTQTRYLADRFPRVVGADLSDAALGHARRADPEGRAGYRRLDAADPEQTGALHAELGDANVYLRAVLHQCEPGERRALAHGVAALLGERGRAFLVEPAESAGPLLMALVQCPEGPPAKLAPVLGHGLIPGRLPDTALPAYLDEAGLAVVAGGRLPLVTTEYTADGIRLELPSAWVIAGRPEPGAG
ncbi:class I SAM-dependent methyltransferase [Streptomyces tagetis]|uniref:Class I SAM-dependent methyltransferase n=1 Tax=Streptomyces tagetis TaxID=2820809 RepID=A0A940XBY4_9ACTN|nr:class I SAM-dependent methyltransferase [Streptomyces sp. RG38]MBQ0825600.1 class I SAM-dependent methyltransferase [Streptomyces sp. RG38]